MTDTEKADVARRYLMRCKYINLEMDTQLEALYRVKTPNYMQSVKSISNKSYDSVLNDKITKLDELYAELKHIRDLVDELSEKSAKEGMYGVVLLSRYILGFNQKETAKLMNLSLDYLKHLQKDALIAFYGILELNGEA